MELGWITLERLAEIAGLEETDAALLALSAHFIWDDEQRRRWFRYMVATGWRVKDVAVWAGMPVEKVQRLVGRDKGILASLNSQVFEQACEKARANAALD